ncbi:nudC domain-containing protein 3 [Ceratitis capitata]|uniref:nudC domain-containing protein 3 n=1 Tax=Ceratitis capitata TaxID=7213 RepID=UPI000329F56A|nr:nudC domain-containing protein 3 [Ceratitis capitata]
MDFLRTDAIFMEVLQQQRTIVGFLDAVFGFLLRNTEFYQYQTDIEKRDREFMVLTAMSRYDPATSLANIFVQNMTCDENHVPPAAEEVEIETEEIHEGTEGTHEDTKGINEDTEEMQEDPKEILEDTEETHENTEGIHKDTEKIHEDTEEICEDTIEINEDTEEIREDTTEIHEETDKIEVEMKELQEETGDVSPALEQLKIEKKKKEQTTILIEEDKKTVAKIEQKDVSRVHGFSAADYENGSCFENYCWAQTQTELELHIKLPSDLSSSKLILIDIKSDNILVRSRSDPNDVIISGQLSNRVKNKDVVWTINEEKLTICLDKRSHIWWDRLFCEEDPIDPKKIKCERYIDELPEDSQAAIQKIHLQQMEQNNQNNEPEKTFSNEEKMKRLRKAWNAEGSPFKGQPFDPSLIKFS